MKMLQAQMSGQAENANLKSEEKIMSLVKDIRKESEDK